MKNIFKLQHQTGHLYVVFKTFNSFWTILANKIRKTQTKTGSVRETELKYKYALRDQSTADIRTDTRREGANKR